ncbi:MAG: hypothetical protein JW934_22555 [Anaerolineae bacterium]|nr:hypothetical protein [Anaerolineae bacterium]
MRVRLTLKPGQRGTKQLVEEYGDRLVCVRYRYDSEQRKRYKTVELIVDEAEWLDQLAPVDALMVGVLVAREETELRTQVKAEGGHWNPERQVWELRYDRVKRLGLEGRLVRDTLGDYEVFAYDVGNEG